MKKFLRAIVYLALVISIALNISLYVKYSRTNENFQHVRKTAARKYEDIFENIAHNNYYQTFDIGRVRLIQGKMEGASYCYEIFSTNYYTYIAREIIYQLDILSQQYYNKGSFSDDDRSVYNQILQEISYVYEALTSEEKSDYITNIHLEVVRNTSSIKDRYNLE